MREVVKLDDGSSGGVRPYGAVVLCEGCCQASNVTATNVPPPAVKIITCQSIATFEMQKRRMFYFFSYLIRFEYPRSVSMRNGILLNEPALVGCVRTDGYIMSSKQRSQHFDSSIIPTIH